MPPQQPKRLGAHTFGSFFDAFCILWRLDVPTSKGVGGRNFVFVPTAADFFPDDLVTTSSSSRTSQFWVQVRTRPRSVFFQGAVEPFITFIPRPSSAFVSSSSPAPSAKAAFNGRAFSQ